MYDLRLVVYAPNDKRLGLLPTPARHETAYPLNDLPSLKLRYFADAVNADLLDDPCEIAVEWSTDGITWAEPPDGRFLRIARGTNSADQAGLRTYECPGYAWQLRKLLLFPPLDLSQLVDGKRKFTAKTAGQILGTFLAEAADRETVPGLQHDFTDTTDSAGAPWDVELTISYEPGVDMLAAIINLAEQGVIDWRCNGRTLQVFNAGGSLARDFATGAAPVDLRLGRDISDAPDRGTWEEHSSAVLVVGDDGFRVGLTRTPTLPWGRWETYLAQGGVTDVGTAVTLAQAVLDRVAGERVQYTRQIEMATARWRPFADYRPGDYLLAPDTSGHMASLRVWQITLVRDRYGVTGGNLVLGDRLLDRDVRLARRQAGIIGGFTGLGGTGRPVSDQRAHTPAAPTGLAVTPDAYVDPADGTTRGLISATWDAVTLDVDGEAVKVTGYELFVRVNTPGAVPYLAATTEGDDTTVGFSPLEAGQSYAFKVRAVAKGAAGLFSDEVAVAIPTDGTPPAVPSTPVLSTRLGQIHAAWDGLDEDGHPMAADFNRVRVWVQDPLAPGATEAGYLQAAGQVVIPDQPYGADREVWFTAVDRTGNQSAPSASALIATAPLVDTDVIGEVIDGVHIVDGTINAAQKVVAESITGGLIQALQIETGHLKANAITTDKIAAGQIVAAHIGANQITAAKLEATLTLATRVVAGSPGGARVELNSTGLVAFNGSGVQTVSIAAATGAVSMIGSLASGATSDRIVINPPGAVNPEIRFYGTSGTAYSRISTTDATLNVVSTITADNTSQTQMTVANNEWRITIWNPSTGNAGGGYIFGQPTQLEVGYNDIGGNLNRFRFTSGFSEHFGKWAYQSGGAGLIMHGWTLDINNRATLAWSFTLFTIPRVVTGVRYDGTTGQALYAIQSNVGTTTYGVGIHASGWTPSPGATAQLHMWCWR